MATGTCGEGARAGGRKKKDREDFKWTDDEAELLLNVTHDYKVKKLSENVDWESVKTKYDDILALMRQELPDTREEVRANSWYKDYPHIQEEITKKVLTAKLKAIRIKFREAVDSGRKSGHGRVVLLYYELCEKIWGGSPATEEIQTGLESTEIVTDVVTDEGHDVSVVQPIDNPEDSTSTTSREDTPDDHDVSDHTFNNLDDSARRSNDDTINRRREHLDNKLSTYKHERMKRKLPVDSQLLSCAQEELVLKKRMVNQMDSFEKQYCETMANVSANMDKIANSISDGFLMLRNLLTPLPPPNSHYYPPHQYHQVPFNPQSSAINYPSPSNSYMFSQQQNSDSQSQ